MRELSGIKNIIFDLGQVIIDLDYQYALGEFKRLGVLEPDKINARLAKSQFFDQFERGILPAKEFRDELRGFIPRKIDDSSLDDLWNAILSSIPTERIELLLRLREMYRLFLLSNTNEIHVKAINNMLMNKFDMRDFSEIFEKVYFSFELGLRKPELEIFETVIIDNKLVPNETLFIDDNLENVESANKMGMQTQLIDERNSILDVFNV